MYRILIFGTGRFFENRKGKIFDNDLLDIIGFADNAPEKQHKSLYGYYIFSPEEIVDLKFHYILLMSIDVINMKNQLLALGVKEKCILSYDDYNMGLYSEMRFYSSINEKTEINYDNLVVLISHELSNTGAPIVLLYMAKLLKKNGYYPIIISGGNGTLQEEILYDEIPLIVCKKINVNNVILNALLKSAVITICNTLVTGYLVEDCARLCNNVVWWLHEGESNYRDMTIPYCKKDFSSNVRIFAVSALTKRVFNNYSVEKGNIEILPYGIPDKGYKEKVISGKIRFLLAGTISKRKGQDILIEAVQLLTDEELDRVEFIFAGTIGEMDIYEKMQGCSLDQISYRGQLNTYEMQELYENIDVVVCPSREDPLPVVLTEGMMNAKICIMSDNTGMASLIKDKEQGIICKAGDTESLAEQIRWVINNTDKLEEIMREGRKFYEENFTMEAFEKRILNIITG